MPGSGTGAIPEDLLCVLPGATVGDTVEADIRGRRDKADVVRRPFVDRSPR